MNPSKRVLLVDDDQVFLKNLEFSLQHYFEIYQSNTLEQAKQILSSTHIDVILLDYQIGSENGHQFMDYMSSSLISTPVVVLSGFIDLEMTKGFLKRKPFDFIEKPATFVEIKAALDNATSNQSGKNKISSIGFEVDNISRGVIINENEVPLTKIEFDLLNFFLKNRKKQISREVLITHVWGTRQVSKNTLDTHLLNLKKKVPPFSEKLVSVYGSGYLFDA
jgi:DNA-binding response OmpR family regulator